jgi:phosphohistidine swiveling domain-containing protein
MRRYGGGGGGGMGGAGGGGMGGAGGDILVTPSTTPDYVPVLKKVSAIITNEGGVLCHAAIISRELRIPCIIGTNNATKILQSGQMVQVDAEQGIVRVIDDQNFEAKKSSDMVWSKLITREGVDITTISQIDAAVYDLHAEAVKEKREIIFTTLKDRYLTHYISFDFKRLGLYLQAKYFPNVKRIINFYTDGVAFLKKTDKETKILQKKMVSGKERDLLKVYKEFRKNFEWAGYFYSMMSWIAIENWQAELEDLVDSLIKKNGLEKETESILAPIYKPWKKTAIMEIQDKLRAGESAEKLAQEYQFMRSWVAVWYKPLTKEWIESIKGGEERNRGHRPALQRRHAQVARVAFPWRPYDSRRGPSCSRGVGRSGAGTYVARPRGDPPPGDFAHHGVGIDPRAVRGSDRRTRNPFRHRKPSAVRHGLSVRLLDGGEVSRDRFRTTRGRAPVVVGFSRVDPHPARNLYGLALRGL